jgi:hypothetical protein
MTPRELKPEDVAHIKGYVPPPPNEFETAIHAAWEEPRNLVSVEFNMIQWINHAAGPEDVRHITVEKLLALHRKAGEMMIHCDGWRYSPFAFTGEIRLLMKEYGLTP